MFEKQEITYIDRKTATGKNNRPYERLSIKTDKYGNTFLSGFGSIATKDWKIGDEVEIKVEDYAKDGRIYKNFDYKREPALADRVKLLEIDVKKIKDYLKTIHDKVDSEPNPVEEIDKAIDEYWDELQK